MFSLFQPIAILLTATAIFAWINYALLKLPSTIGLLIMGLLASLLLVGLEAAFPGIALFHQLIGTVRDIDFSKTLLDGMLAFLLFAGALHVDFSRLRGRGPNIGVMATIGVVISTAVVAGGVWWASAAIGSPLPLAWAIVFGALISPTDPVAVISTLKSAPVPETLETDMVGESLFNDGVGVVLFTILVAAAASGDAGIDLPHIAHLFFVEAVGGGVLGLLTGYAAYRAMRRIDEYGTEVLISLSLVMGAYALADVLRLSGPIAVVVAGLIIGNRGKSRGMSETTRRYLYAFWTLIDEILNSVLFLLIGLEVLILQFEAKLGWFAAATVPIVLLARLCAVALPTAALSAFVMFVRGTIPVLTWGGVRGGISIALALSLPDVPERAPILAATYAVAVFSIVFQGLTLSAVLKRTANSR